MPMYYRAIELLFSADCICNSPLIDDLDPMYMYIQPDLQKANYTYLEYSISPTPYYLNNTTNVSLPAA